MAITFYLAIYADKQGEEFTFENPLCTDFAAFCREIDEREQQDKRDARVLGSFAFPFRRAFRIEPASGLCVDVTADVNRYLDDAEDERRQWAREEARPYRHEYAAEFLTAGQLGVGGR